MKTRDRKCLHRHHAAHKVKVTHSRQRQHTTNKNNNNNNAASTATSADYPNRVKEVAAASDVILVPKNNELVVHNSLTTMSNDIHSRKMKPWTSRRRFRRKLVIFFVCGLCFLLGVSLPFLIRCLDKSSDVAFAQRLCSGFLPTSS